MHVRFTSSTTTHRLHYPPKRGDFFGSKYFTGSRWVRLTANRLKSARQLAGDKH